MTRTDEYRYCVYFHVNKKTSAVFYVGMGNKRRPYMTQGRNKWWRSIVKKYGYDITIVHDNLKWEDAIDLEISYIASIGRRDLNKGTLVNLTDGGDGAPHGHTPWNKGIPMSIETKRKLSESMSGEGNPNYGKPCSDERKAKITESNKLVQVKPVLQYTKTNEFVREYVSIKEASEITGFNKTTIGKCCRGTHSIKSVGGYVWKFKYPEDKFRKGARK